MQITASHAAPSVPAVIEGRWQSTAPWTKIGWRTTTGRVDVFADPSPVIVGRASLADAVAAAKLVIGGGDAVLAVFRDRARDTFEVRQLQARDTSSSRVTREDGSAGQVTHADGILRPLQLQAWALPGFTGKSAWRITPAALEGVATLEALVHRRGVLVRSGDRFGPAVS